MEKENRPLQLTVDRLFLKELNNLTVLANQAEILISLANNSHTQEAWDAASYAFALYTDENNRVHNLDPYFDEDCWEGDEDYFDDDPGPQEGYDDNNLGC